MAALLLALVKSIYYRIIESVFRLNVWLHEAGPSIFNFGRHFFNRGLAGSGLGLMILQDESQDSP